MPLSAQAIDAKSNIPTRQKNICRMVEPPFQSDMSQHRKVIRNMTLPDSAFIFTISLCRLFSLLGSVRLQGVLDWWKNIWLSIRCSLIGVIVGVIPGLGGSVVDWIAYGHTVQTTSDKKGFGSGEIRGVIGPESSNNAKEGGGLVPTLIFGIPGSGSMAILLGGMALLGYDAGPQLITNNPDITYTTVWPLGGI